MKTAWIAAYIETIMPASRTKGDALFIRCTEEEAERIRHAANAERRTVSGYILNAVLTRIAAKERLLSEAHNPPPSRPLMTHGQN